MRLVRSELKTQFVHHMCAQAINAKSEREEVVNKTGRLGMKTKETFALSELLSTRVASALVVQRQLRIDAR